MARLTPSSRVKSRELRSNLTDAEQMLWRHLRMRQLAGFRFRRQHPVGEYVLDFVCMEERLAMEIDGGQHAELAIYDAQRTQQLQEKGYRVLRFSNNDVLQYIEGVKAEICRALGAPPPP